ncbi:hypothetical protein D6D29_10424 [Aureobasidium pullulans]|nr:hypothetical protein D6D29_10424 [Aureobasidium pullulans]THV76690.1 hypothetical protein D6D27_09247 [Aureobasidium pullulans]
MPSNSCLKASLLALLVGGATAFPTVSWSNPFASSKDATLVARQWVDEPTRNLFCRYNPTSCQKQFPGYCDGSVKKNRPIWCDDIESSRHDDDDLSKAITLVARQEGHTQRQMYCHNNPTDCESAHADDDISKPVTQRQFYCHNNPADCESARPEEDDVSKAVTLVARQVGNPQRQVFCHHNPIPCLEQWPEYCTDPAGPAEWCNDFQKTLSKAVALVARQVGNPQRQNFCHFNPTSCLEQWPEYCTDPAGPAEWCNEFRKTKRSASAAPVISHDETLYWCGKHPEQCKALTLRLVAEADSSDVSNTENIWSYPVHSICAEYPQWPECVYLSESQHPDVVARNDIFNIAASADKLHLAARQEADPKRSPTVDPPVYENETILYPDPPETRPVPVTRDWCDHHPHHSYCSSQWCMDHPNQCKNALDPNPPHEQRALRCAEIYKLDWRQYGELPQGCQLKCLDGGDRRGECDFRTHEWCEQHPDHRDCEVPT